MNITVQEIHDAEKALSCKKQYVMEGKKSEDAAAPYNFKPKRQTKERHLLLKDHIPAHIPQSMCCLNAMITHISALPLNNTEKIK